MDHEVADDDEWEVRTGEFVAINAVVISCKHPKVRRLLLSKSHKALRMS